MTNNSIFWTHHGGLSHFSRKWKISVVLLLPSCYWKKPIKMKQNITFKILQVLYFVFKVVLNLVPYQLAWPYNTLLVTTHCTLRQQKGWDKRTGGGWWGHQGEPPISIPDSMDSLRKHYSHSVESWKYHIGHPGLNTIGVGCCIWDPLPINWQGRVLGLWVGVWQLIVLTIACLLISRHGLSHKSAY